MEITVGSLFSGIGGLDLGLERAGMKVIWQSEIDKYCCKVLKKHWPEVPNHGDIKEINWQEIERPTVIAGGYPCQPFSQAGKRKGTQDPRHLWPWVRTAISELRPDYAILENVPGHLTLGGTEVIGALAEIGYDAEWRVVSAAGLGANHLRKRIIIVAYPNGGNTPNGRQCTQVSSIDQCRANDRSGSKCDSGQIGVPSARQSASVVAYANDSRKRTSASDLDCKQSQNQQIWHYTQHESGRCGQTVYNTNIKGLQRRCVFQESQTQFARFDQSGEIAGWQNHWLVEPNVGRVADGVPVRLDRLKTLGNAVVPQIPEIIGKAIMQHEYSLVRF